MLSGLDVKVKPGGMQKMAVSLMEGYQAYAKTHPEADYSHLGDNFFEYLKTDGAKQIMKKYFSKILKESGKVTITEEKVQKLLTDIMQGFEKYRKGSGNRRYQCGPVRNIFPPVFTDGRSKADHNRLGE